MIESGLLLSDISCVNLLDLSVLIATVPTKKHKTLDFHGSVVSVCVSTSLIILLFSPFSPPTSARCGSDLLVKANR